MKNLLAIFVVLVVLPLDFVSYSQQKTSLVSEQSVRVRRARIVAAGDLMQHSPQISAALRQDGRYDYSRSFQYVAPYFQNADLAIVNLETKREIEWLQELPKNNIFNVGIRLNVSISKISPDDAKTNDDYSRFGFSFESGELTKAINQINLLENIKLRGLHVHRTSKTRSTSFYKKLLEYTYNIIDKMNLKLDYLDIGGGYFGIFSNAPTYNEYSNAFHEVISKHKRDDITIIVEPGNGVVASAFSYVTSVIDTKKVDGKLIVSTNGSRNDIDPLFSKSNYLKEIIHKQQNTNFISTQIITGATCLEFDKIFSIENSQELHCGDLIKYNNVGAYTMCLTPLFINYFPRVYIHENNSYTIIRDKWTANDYITKSKLF